MSRPLKYGEPTVDIHIRVPKSRKEEIREVVRERLSGNDGWIEIKGLPSLDKLYGFYWVCTVEGLVTFHPMTDKRTKLVAVERCTHYMPATEPKPPKSK